MKTVARETTAARPYRQNARAQASARTRQAILDAAVELAMEKAGVNMPLADVAERAGVSVQTVLRHFGTRDGLLDAALRYGNQLIATERRAPDGDVRAAVEALFEHYEARGDSVIRLLGQEHVDARIALITESGRRVHREWVAHLLPQDSPLRDDDAIIDQLVVVTDVYTWKLLRRDRGLARAEAEHRVLSLIGAVLGAAAERSGSS